MSNMKKMILSCLDQNQEEYLKKFLNASPERCITIPMIPMGRSLNLSNSAVIILYEAYRQLGFNF